MNSVKLANISVASILLSPFISVCVPSFAFARIGQEEPLISCQFFKDSFGYYATRVSCRRWPRCHRRWLCAPLTSPRHLRCVSSSADASTVSLIASKNFTSSALCCRDSLSLPLRGSMACVPRALDGDEQVCLPRRISGATGLRANHEKRPFARKSRGYT